MKVEIEQNTITVECDDHIQTAKSLAGIVALRIILADDIPTYDASRAIALLKDIMNGVEDIETHSREEKLNSASSKILANLVASYLKNK